MKWYRSADGEHRIWYEQDEIEAIMSDELRKAGLMPTAAKPVTDVEVFVEAHLKANLDQYAHLDDDVLGLTEFAAGARPRVRINRTLTEEALDEDDSSSVFGRWRATVAHEGAHVVLHRCLFELGDLQTSFLPTARGDPPRLLRCLKRDVSYTRMTGDWREVQANRGMAALLMPTQLFANLVTEETAAMGAAPIEAGTEHARLLTARMAARFQVSREAASIRLNTLGCLLSPGQISLPIA